MVKGFKRVVWFFSGSLTGCIVEGLEGHLRVFVILLVILQVKLVIRVSKSAFSIFFEFNRL